MSALTTALSATSLYNHNPWKPLESSQQRYARHWRRFCSDQNTERQYRGEAPFCNTTQRDRAFLKLMRVAQGGDEERDNGRLKRVSWEGEGSDSDAVVYLHRETKKAKNAENGGRSETGGLGEMAVEVGGNVDLRMGGMGEEWAVVGGKKDEEAMVEWREVVNGESETDGEAEEDDWEQLMLVRTGARKTKRHDSKDVGGEKTSS